MSKSPSHLPDATGAADAFAEATAIARAAAAAGFDWQDALGPLAKVREEADEVQAAWHASQAATDDASRQRAQADLTGELGDLLFAALNVCRLAGIEPAAALFSCNARFVGRFRAMEAMGLPSTPRGDDVAHWDALWQEAKRKGAP